MYLFVSELQFEFVLVLLSASGFVSALPFAFVSALPFAFESALPFASALA